MSIINRGTPLRVYLAAPYSYKELMIECASELRAQGVRVTSRWLQEEESPATQLSEVSPEKLRKYAQQDIEDVVAADLMVFFTDPTKTIVRAGRHVEYGMAIGLGLSRPYPIYVVGEDRENIFHHCRQVTHFPSWEKTKERILELARIERV